MFPDITRRYWKFILIECIALILGLSIGACIAHADDGEGPIHFTAPSYGEPIDGLKQSGAYFLVDLGPLGTLLAQFASGNILIFNPATGQYSYLITDPILTNQITTYQYTDSTHVFIIGPQGLPITYDVTKLPGFTAPPSVNLWSPGQQLPGGNPATGGGPTGPQAPQGSEPNRMDPADHPGPPSAK